MPGRVENTQEILINSIRYPVKGPIHRFLASRPTQRFAIGNAGPTVHQDLSYMSWDDWRGGIGIERIDPDQDGDRCWWSTCTLRQKRHLTLPGLATRTAASGVTGVFDVTELNERNNVIFGVFGSAVRSYNNSTDSWGSTLRTLGANATHSVNIRMSNTEYLIFAYTTGYDYYNGTTWASSTRDAKYLAYLKDRLWGIDENGQLWWSTSLGTETLDAQLPLPNNSVTNLFVGRAPSGDLVLYASTTNGLWIHNADLQQFEPTELELPYHPDNGLGAVRWRDSSYVSAGLGIYKFVHGTNQTVIDVMGPDQDHGLPAAYRGRIRRLISTLNGLVALLDATTGATITTMFSAEQPSNGDVIDPDAGRSALLDWDGRGWQVLWASDADTLPVTVAHVSNAYNSYRIWWAQNQRVYWMILPRDITNPNQITDRTYAASATHEIGWFDADETHVNKAAIVVCTHAVNASSTETIALRYRLNDNDSSASQTTLGTITADGHNEFFLPNPTTPTGTAFRTIKFVLDFARGSNNTLTPDMDRLEFYFLRKEEVRWGVSVRVVIPPQGYGGASARQMYDNLLTTAALGLQFEVTWRAAETNAAGDANPYNYYMQVMPMQGDEQSGADFSGEHTVVLVQRGPSP